MAACYGGIDQQRALVHADAIGLAAEEEQWTVEMFKLGFSIYTNDGHARSSKRAVVRR